MSRSARGPRPKMPSLSSPSPSASSISGGKPNQGLEAMLHVTQVQTSCDNEEFYYYKDDRKTSKSNLSSLEVKTPDLEEAVPQDPPFVALVSNLPMECNERELTQVLSNFSICSLTIPKKGKRPKAFAYVELNSREELIRLLRLEKLKCRGRLLSIKVSPDREIVQSERGTGTGSLRGLRGAGGGDAHFSDFDGSSTHYSASVSDLSTADFPSSPDGSPRLGSESSFDHIGMPISRKPSSIEELERRMDIRLKKLADFENAQSEREQSSQLDDQDDGRGMSWSDILSETRKSEGL